MAILGVALPNFCPGWKPWAILKAFPEEDSSGFVKQELKYEKL